MRLIGILGGTSWPSTMLPYRLLNEEVQRRVGQHHSARVVVYSIDYHAIKSRYHDGWAEIPSILRREIETLISFGPDCWMLANNTLHRAYDAIAQELTYAPPFFHAVELVRAELVGSKLRRVLLLGTKFTMEDGFFARPLLQAGITVDVPNESDRVAIQEIQTRLSRGEIHPDFGTSFQTILAKHESQGCEAVITACTELPLVIHQSMTQMRLIDPLVLQCRACVDFALSGTP